MRWHVTNKILLVFIRQAPRNSNSMIVNSIIRDITASYVISIMFVDNVMIEIKIIRARSVSIAKNGLGDDVAGSDSVEC